MKFKSDENLPVEVVDLLRQEEGHDALSVVDQQLAGRLWIVVEHQVRIRGGHP